MDFPLSRGSRLTPSTFCFLGSGTPHSSRIVGYQSIPLAGVSLMDPGLVVPGAFR